MRRAGDPRLPRAARWRQCWWRCRRRHWFGVARSRRDDPALGTLVPAVAGNRRSCGAAGSGSDRRRSGRMDLLRWHARLHPLRPAEPDRPDQCRAPAGGLAAAGHRCVVDRAVSRVGAVRLPAGHPDFDRRGPLRVECRRPRRGIRSGHRRDPLAAAAAAPDAGRGGGPRGSRRGVLVGGCGPAHLLVPQPVPLCTRRGDRGVDSRVRQRGPRRSDPCRCNDRPRRGESDRGGRRHRGGGRGGRRRRQRRALAQQRAGERAGIRRADRRAAVDVPRGAASGRARRRYLGRGFPRCVGRPRVVVLPQRRPGAGIRLRAAYRADRRLLRRPPARRQPLLQQPGRARRRHRRAGLALPDGASRPVGVRHGGAPDTGGDYRRRPPHPRRDAAEQDRIPVRVRPGDG